MIDTRTPHVGRRTAFEKTATVFIDIVEKIDESDLFSVFMVSEEPICEYHEGYGTSAPSDFLNDWWEYEHEYD